MARAIHKLRQHHLDPWPGQVDDWLCSCGSAVWLDVSSAVCIASDQGLGRIFFDSPSDGAMAASARAFRLAKATKS